MSYAFHDITRIVKAYLNHLIAHSKKRVDHPAHLRLIFDRCQKYKIRLNPLKCNFCVVASRLLGFIISKDEIMVDPFKVEAILQLSPLRTVHQLQSLQGKANFLRQFIANYAEITKGFMRLLKKQVPFSWDERAQRSFEALKKSISSAPILSPPDYNKDFILYFVASKSTIGMVLVQEDESLQEHAIYYLSRSLVEAELSYAHVDKLDLVAIHTTQRLRHYLTLCKTYVVACLNPFQYILTRCMIGGKSSKWIVILQDFDLEFRLAKAKKSLILTELLSNLRKNNEDISYDESPVDDHLFLIASYDLWYGTIIVYLQTTKFPSDVSREERRCIRHQAKHYLIINDTLYR